MMDVDGDLNEARLDMIEQIGEFLAGTADVVFATPDDQEALHQFVATVLERHQFSNSPKATAACCSTTCFN